MRKAIINTLFTLILILLFSSINLFANETPFEAMVIKESFPVLKELRESKKAENLYDVTEAVEKNSAPIEKANYATCITPVVIGRKIDNERVVLSPFILYLYKRDNSGIAINILHKETIKLFLGKVKGFPKKIDDSECIALAKKNNKRVYSITEYHINLNLHPDFMKIMTQYLSEEEIKANQVVIKVSSPEYGNRPELEKKFYYPASEKISLNQYNEFLDQIFAWIEKEEEVFKLKQAGN